MTAVSTSGAVSGAGEWDFFVGHTGADRVWAEWICWQLEAAGFRVLVQAWDFVPGMVWAERIRAGLARATQVIVVLSPAYVGSSRFGITEWRAAWSGDPGEALRSLVGVWVARCDRPGVLARVAGVDLFDVSEASARARLRQAIAVEHVPARAEPVLASGPSGAGDGAQPTSGAVRSSPPFPTGTPGTPGPVGGYVGPVAVYRHQIARIAAAASPRLVNREAELRELTAFCTAPHGQAYLWWQAPAWAGMSTLMANFVLHPPAQIRDRVRIVPFFITPHLAGQDTRATFMTCILEQFADPTRGGVPPALNEAVVEQELRFQFTHAPAVAHGRRLVLVVDGLDDERVARTGGRTRSIAGLLPVNPLYGLRIIVTGRPDATLPDDVPAGHPLRDPRIMRRLDPSPEAGEVRRLTASALHRLLTGTPIQQDLLGLLVAARGSLLARDLNELTGASGRVIDQTLQTVAGRAASPRGDTPPPDAGTVSYLLAHQELQTTAAEFFGEQRLGGYRDRLHGWAEVYRARRWPAGTPDYLLRDYSNLLAATRDLPRLVTCATDTARHQRMLELPGGAAAARAETRTALTVNADQDHPDLVAALRLAYHRDLVPAEYSTHAPRRVLGVAALLADTVPAPATAGEAEPSGRPRVPATVAQTLARADHPARAALTTRAQARIHQTGDLNVLGLALAVLAGPQPDDEHRDPVATLLTRVKAAARAIDGPDAHVDSLAAVAQALAAAGHPEQATALALHAEIVARALLDDHRLGAALTTVAQALAYAERPDRAVALAAEIQTLLPDLRQQAQPLTAIAQALAYARHPDQATALALQIAALAPTPPDPFRLGHPLACVAQALARADHPDHAETLARTITDPYHQAAALAVVAGTLARTGRRDRATALAAQAQAVARTLPDPYQQAHALTAVAQAVAETGDLDLATTLATQAETLARTITDTTLRVLRTRALMAVAHALAVAGQPDRATALATQAEITQRTMTDPYPEPQDLTTVARALTRAGHPDDAQTVARTIHDLYRQADALAAIARILVETGATRSARKLTAEAAAVVHWTTLVAPTLSMEPSTTSALLDLTPHTPHP